MKIVLINPLWAKDRKLRGPVYNRIWPPLSLATAAAMMRERGLEVRIIDANALGIEGNDLSRLAAGADIAFITSSTLDKWVCPNTEIDPFLDAVSSVKKVVDHVVVVGVHGSVRPRHMLSATDAYAVVIGEPEGTMLELAIGAPREITPGLAFLDHDGLTTTAPRPLLDLTTLPPPAMDLLPLPQYRYEILGNRLMILEATRGCPHSCTFCLRAMYGGKACRKKRPDQICAEIRDAVLTHNVESIYFMDIEFTIDKHMALAVCDCVENLGRELRWCCQTRADSLDDELVGRMRATGCTLVHFGVESGSDRILRSIGKGEDTAEILKGVRLVQDAGMETACFFMFGFPGETQEDMKQTIRFSKRLSPTYASFHVMEPYPGTPVAKQVQDSIGSDFFPIDYQHADIDLRAMQRKALVQFYLRPTYVIRRLARGGWGMLWQQMRIFADYLR